jgi:hypothetical protein
MDMMDIVMFSTVWLFQMALRSDSDGSGVTIFPLKSPGDQRFDSMNLDPDGTGERP